MHFARLKIKKTLIRIRIFEAMVSARDSCKRALVTLVRTLAWGWDVQCPAGSRECPFCKAGYIESYHAFRQARKNNSEFAASLLLKTVLYRPA